VDNEDDFEPLGSDLAKLGVEEGKESMRIEVGTASEKALKAKDEKEKKEINKETLLIGKRVSQAAGKKGEEQYYGRLLSDQGVFRISAKLLEPVKLAAREPTRVRSHDVVVYDPKSVDAITFNVSRQ